MTGAGDVPERRASLEWQDPVPSMFDQYLMLYDAEKRKRMGLKLPMKRQSSLLPSSGAPIPYIPPGGIYAQANWR